MPEQRKRATALQYGANANAPQIVAQGTGVMAERIIEAAKEAGIPVRDDAALAEALSKLDLGSEVPQALYIAVAEALAWAYRLNASAERNHGLRQPR